MIRFQRSRAIDASTEAVWAVLSRFMHADEISPAIVSVDALTSGEDGIGSRRRNNFENGTSVVEEVTAWSPGKGFTVELSEMDAMPLHEASAQIEITPQAQISNVVWTFSYRVKYGPIGWLLGQTMMKMMMSKILDGNLKALDDRVQTINAG